MTIVSSTRFVRALVGLALIGLSSSNLAARGGGGGDSIPVIASVSTVTHPGHLTLRGNAFGGTPPKVYLGTQQLRVTQNSEREIVARLPDNLAPAAYSLVVRNRSQRSQPFTLQVAHD